MTSTPNPEHPTAPQWARDLPARDEHTLAHLADSGLLWWINRSLLHPSGYALAVAYNPDGTDIVGWSLHYAGDPISYADDIDEAAKLAAVEQLFATARQHRVSPPNGHPQWPATSDD